MKGTIGQAVASTRAALRTARFWETLSVWLLWGWLAAGLVLLISRLTWPPAVWIALGLAAAAAVAAVAAAARTPQPSETSAAVLLDRRGHLEGLPLLAGQDGDRAWMERFADRLAAARDAVPRVRAGRFALRILPAAAFLAAAFAVPQRRAFESHAASSHSAVRREADRIEQLIEILEKRDALSQEEADRAREELETLTKSDVGAETWEGLDQLSDRLHQKASEKEASLDRASSEAERLSRSLDELQEKEEAEALEKILSQSGKLPEELRKRLDQGKADPQELEKALKDLKEYLDSESQELAEETERLHDHGEGG